jgi:hypothetical protein
MSDDLELTIEAVERDKFYDRTISDILKKPPVSSAPSGDYKITSTKITQKLKSGIYILSTEYSPESWLTASRLTLEHGFSIMLHKNKDYIANMHTLRYEALKSPKNAKNPFIMQLVMGYESILISPDKKSQKVNLKIQPRYMNALSKISAELSFRNSDIITMCMWYSLLTCETTPEYIKEEGNIVVADFEAQVAKMQEMHSMWFDAFVKPKPEDSIQSTIVPPTDSTLSVS